MSTYYYSLIKCTTDVKRLETVNIGIVVFKGNEFDVRLLENATKLNWFVNDTIEDSLNDLAERYTFFTSHAESAQEKHGIIQSFKGPISIGGLGFFSAKNDRDYSHNLARLMGMLVEPPKQTRNIQKNHFSTTLKDYFISKNLLGKNEKDILKHKVVPNFMIDQALDIKAEFMLKNGIYHLTETLDFNAHKGLTEKRKQTAYKLLTFDRADKILGDLGSDVARYFVYSANAQNEEKAKALLDLMEDNNAAMFNWDSSSDIKTYTNIMQEHASTGSDKGVILQ